MTTTTTTTKPYAVNLYESHPDAGNDDCRTGLDFDLEVDAYDAFQLPQDHFRRRSLAGCTHIELTGPNGLRRIEKLMSDAQIAELTRGREVESKRDDAEWRRERAMQAGMMGGCEAYNDEMGF